MFPSPPLPPSIETHRSSFQISRNIKQDLIHDRESLRGESSPWKLIGSTRMILTPRFQSLSSFLLVRNNELRTVFLVIRVPDQSAEPLTISHNRISKGVESAKRLHRYLNFDGNHARSTLQLHVSSGFCASVTLRSRVTHRGGQDRVLFASISIHESLPFRSSFSPLLPLLFSPRFGELTKARVSLVQDYKSFPARSSLRD